MDEVATEQFSLCISIHGSQLVASKVLFDPIVPTNNYF